MAEPAHATVAAEYARQIRAGVLAAGARLPSQAELAARHGVSRVVVRRALELLREQRLVHTVARRGTFVGDGSARRAAEPVDDDVDEIRAVAHPIRRAQLAASLITHYQLRIAELSGIRQTAIEDAHDQGMSLTDIGARLGLTDGLRDRMSRADRFG
ncbi:winged helix-turn-helix domain-containing protein [Nocardia brasiliensis]|uniref:winged helix-turn-helix domain-containing protein n=1 Tax=Nocardia brasiliensis TaxID=37326 RepID=UPI003D8A8682